MTSPASVDVKGKGKARGRRRAQPDGAAGDASGAPTSPPDSPDEEAATEAASAGAPRPGEAGDDGPESTAVPPDDRSPAVTGPAVNPAANARAAARQRRAQENADQAAEIEAAALAESLGESRRRQRDRKRAAATAAAAAAAMAGESRREQRARKRAAAAAVVGSRNPLEGSRRGRRSQDRAELAGDAAGGSRRERREREAPRRQAGAGYGDGADWAGGQTLDLRPEHADRESPDARGDGVDLTGRSRPGFGADDGPVAGPAPSRTGPTVTGALTAAKAAAAATGGRQVEPRPGPTEPGPPLGPEDEPEDEEADHVVEVEGHPGAGVAAEEPDDSPEPAPATGHTAEGAQGADGMAEAEPGAVAGRTAEEPDDGAEDEPESATGHGPDEADADAEADGEGEDPTGRPAPAPGTAALDQPVRSAADAAEEPRFVPRPMPVADRRAPTAGQAGHAGRAGRPAPARGSPPSASPREPASAPVGDRTATLPARPLPARPLPARPLPAKRPAGDRRPAAPGPGTTPPPRGRGGKQVPRAVVLRQRRRRRRIVIGTTILLVVVNLLVGSAYVYFQWRLDQINRVPGPGLADDVAGEVMNVLLVGSDSRERLTGQDAAQAGKAEVGGQRSDTIMVLHVDPRQQRAAILAVPRDLYVPIPGTNGSDRVNAAFAIGGAERLIGALSGIGVQVNHYAEVDFVGFKEIVDAIGGVPVFLRNWVRDFSSGLDVPRSGCVELNGREALAYVRSRQFESLVDGKWVTDPSGDLGRIERQQDFIRRVMKKGVSAGVSNPVALNRLIGIGVRNLTIDDTMSTKDISNVARRFRTVDPDSVETLVLPTSPQTIDGKAVLVLQDDQARDEIAKINGAAPLEPPGTPPGPTGPTAPGSSGAVKPGDVRLQILNGNGTRGMAKSTADAFKAAGFNVVGTGDSPTVSRTMVRYASGQEAKGRFIAFGLPEAQVQLDPKLTSADVVLVLGADFTGIRDPNVSPTTVAGGPQNTNPGAPAPAPAPAPATTAPPTPAC